MGRPLGSVNQRQISAEMPEIRRNVGREFLKRLRSKDEEQRWEAAKAIAPYVFPKLTTAMIQGDKENPVVLKIDSDDAKL